MKRKISRYSLVIAKKVLWEKDDIQQLNLFVICRLRFRNFYYRKQGRFIDEEKKLGRN